MESLDESLKEYEDLISSFIQIKNEQEDEIDKIRQSAQEINTSIYKINDDIESIKSTLWKGKRKPCLKRLNPICPISKTMKSR